MEKFIELMADVLEVETEEISLDTDFREDVDDFSSLVGFAMIVMMEEEYGVKITVPQFLEAKTLGDIYNMIPKK